MSRAAVPPEELARHVARRAELLLQAATALDDQTDPFTTEWLAEHHVTLDEAYDLGEDLAIGARMRADYLTQARRAVERVTRRERGTP